MRQLTRRTVLAGASAAAATSLAPISGIRRAGAEPPCMTESLKAFRQRAALQALAAKERELLVGQAIDLLNNFYAHLPKKRELYGIDPIGRLEDLQRKIWQTPPIGDRQFHTDMSEIFDSLRDLHTVYHLPAPYSRAHCWLPFKVEACVDQGQRKFIVSRVFDGFNQDSNFVAGAEIVSWGGVPIEKAIDLAGARGTNPAARRALGLARLTYRALLRHAPPREDSVVVRYRSGGEEREIEFPWNVSLMPGECGLTATACTEIEQLQAFRRFLFAPYNSCTHFLPKPERIVTPDGQFGYLRIFTFEALGLTGDRDTQFVEQFRAQVEDLAKDTKGLIIDVRDNGGGMSRASERCVQLVKQTTKEIEPARHYFRANVASLRLCQLGQVVPDVASLGCKGMGEWVKSIEQAMKSNKTFSDAFPYTCLSDANSIGRKYPGPVIVVTSALSYSAAELFTAAFKDHDGFVLGVDETTGGGGAGVRPHDQLHWYFVAGKQPSPLQELGIDKGAFTVAFRRSVRVSGPGAGKDIEDTGVESSETYQMTRNDVLNHNADLKMHAAQLLAKMK